MAAGEGFKTWATGDVLTANDVNGYLMQGVWVFDDAADRTAQVTSPEEGNVSYLKDTNSVEYYSGAAWVAVGGSTGGFTKITSNLAFSGSSTVSINNCFTSTYTSYLVIFDNMAAASGTAVTFRLRVSGSDNSTSNYDQGNQAAGYGGGGGNETASNATDFRMWGSVGSGSEKANMMFWINNPQTATQTTWSGTGNNNDAGYRVSGQFNGTTAFDGFSIIGGSNLSGNITIYGLEK
jgi:hypothetical protein